MCTTDDGVAAVVRSGSSLHLAAASECRGCLDTSQRADRSAERGERRLPVSGVGRRKDTRRYLAVVGGRIQC